MSDAAAAPGLNANQRNYPLLLRRLQRLMDITQGLASTLEQGKLLRRIVEAACELTDTEVASILLLDARTGELRFECSTDLEAGAFQGVVVPREASLAGWIATHSSPVVVADTHRDPRWNSSVDAASAFNTRSLIGVPLVARGETIGVLEAINKRAGTFTEDDLTTLQWLAAHASVAIVNTRLFHQSDLMAELVHELRTPLTALMATSQLLLRPELPDSTRVELAHTLQREAGRLNDLATGFLDVARLESGRVRFDFARLDVAEVISECARLTQPLAAENNITLETALAPNLGEIESDRGKVKQVLLNLLTNAIKYNRRGGHVEVAAERQAGRVAVTVRDTGPGIPASSLPRIFERFYRVSDAEGYSTGTGLGLAVAKRLVEALGGAIDVESGSGGSAFTFWLPLAPKKTGPLAG